MPREPFPDRSPDDPEPDRSGWRRADDRGPPSDSQAAEQGLFVCLPAEELTLAGFAQNGRADTMAPGPLLSTVLEAITGEDGSGLAGHRLQDGGQQRPRGHRVRPAVLREPF